MLTEKNALKTFRVETFEVKCSEYREFVECEEYWELGKELGKELEKASKMLQIFVGLSYSAKLKAVEKATHSMDKREKSVYLSEIELSGLKPAKSSKTRFKKCFY